MLGTICVRKEGTGKEGERNRGEEDERKGKGRKAIREEERKRGREEEETFNACSAKQTHYAGIQDQGHVNVTGGLVCLV